MLRRYVTVKDIVRDLRRMKKINKLLAAETNDGDESGMKTYNMRTPGGGKRPVSEKFRTGKIPREQQRGINRESKRFAALMEQQKTINHIIFSINTEFSSDDHPQLDKMRNIAKRIGKHISDKIEETKEAASQAAKDTAPDILMRLANNVQKKLADMLDRRSSKHEIINLAGMIRPPGSETTIPQHTVYLVYHDVKSDSGQITAQHVFAISLLNNKLYVNPALHAIKVPGQFRIGYEIPMGNELAKVTNEAIKRIEAQLEADEHLAVHNALPIPVDINRLKLSNLHSVLRSRMKGNVLQVEIDKSIGSEAQATELMNLIYRNLYNAAIAVMPKIRINRALKKTRDHWLAQFSFLPTDKLSGRTMERNMVDKLREIGLFDREIRQIRHIIET